jgi:hypothetical protein
VAPANDARSALRRCPAQRSEPGRGMTPGRTAFTAASGLGLVGKVANVAKRRIAHSGLVARTDASAFRFGAVPSIRASNTSSDRGLAVRGEKRRPSSLAHRRRHRRLKCRPRRLPRHHPARRRNTGRHESAQGAAIGLLVNSAVQTARRSCGLAPTHRISANTSIGSRPWQADSNVGRGLATNRACPLVPCQSPDLS